MLRAFLKQLLRKRKTIDVQAHDGDWVEQAKALQHAGRHEEAAAACRAHLERKPDDSVALQGLAAALSAQGRATEGVVYLERAAALAPDVAELQANLARMYAATGDFDAAIRSYRQALELSPNLGNSAVALTELLKVTGRYDEAEDCCRAILAVSGDSSLHRHLLAGALFEQGRVEEAVAELRASLTLDPHAPMVHSDLLRALNYPDGIDPLAVFQEHCAWALRHADPLAGNAPSQRNSPDPERRLRVGYVSPYFRKHAVTFFLESVIEHHDRDRFDVLLYADTPRPDDYSERLKKYGAVWRSTVGASDEALASMVREDGVDILVDLSGHTPSHRLLAFARRPAPVQVTWNGYPNTTGMTAMDYRITDARCDPPGETERLHTERLVRLPHVYMSWRPPTDAPEPGPLPAVTAGRITFGSFNSCFKITPTVIGLWSRILNATPGAQLVLFTIGRGRAEQRLREQFAGFGIGADRLEIRPRVPHEAFLEAHREIDIALDSFPYHGTTTTCFSLWMGVPVVVLAGATHVSRVGLTLVSSIGLPQLAASDPDGYVAAAIELARDVKGLGALRSGLRRRMLTSPLTDGPACARALEREYREMWSTWCAQSRS